MQNETHTVHHRGDAYTVTTSPHGDHIVVKHNKRDPDHVYPVDSASGTWARVVGMVTPGGSHAQAAMLNAAIAEARRVMG